MKIQALSEVYNEDCMEVMKRFADNHFHLAIVDPPYGIGADKHHLIPTGGKAVAKKKNYGIKAWDNSKPNQDYFIELQRVSKNQIIWGGNYFIENLQNTSCFLVWDKVNGENNFADCELAWTSFNGSVRQFTFRWQGMLQHNMKDKEIRIHPTQKPVALYDWLLMNYANPNDLILDTHLGSGSSRIAANKAGLSFVGCEIDKEYFDKQNKRYQEFISQTRLF